MLTCPKKVKFLPGCSHKLIHEVSDAVWTNTKKGSVPNPVKVIAKGHIRVSQRGVVLKALLL